MAKMWAGRFSKEVDETVNAFNSSIAFDGRMYKHDIQGSIAHAAMLGKCGIISMEDSEKIQKGLKEILLDIENGKLEFDMTAEDIHMFVEAELTKRLGDVGKRLHTARSRNDQVALDIKLYLRDEIAEISALVKKLAVTLCDMAEKHLDTVMPGYTHLQRAQPVTLAHHLMAYANMLTRDLGRLNDTAKRMNYCPLGSCALAGTTYPIDRHMTSEALMFTAPVLNSLDGVSDRDFCIELACAVSILMTHLSRFSEEIIMWCSWEFKFIELDDAYATGSSIMPQKKNPDITELIRGKTGRTTGDLVTLLSMLKGLPLAYNKDMQEDKEAVFDCVDTVKMCLRVFTPMIAAMKACTCNMYRAAQRGFLNATDLADYLTKKGLPFRAAYKIAGQLVAYCIEHTTVLEELPLTLLQQYSELFGEDVYAAIALTNCVTGRTSLGGTCVASVEAQIASVRDFLAGQAKNEA
ncbi:MAG TPA: argininosuccinate lyase [Ruminococcus sp.]|nr:argininosuccinate lyase [Ruminococcus sp.]